MHYFVRNVAHIQLSFRRLVMQRRLNARYAFMRFGQELSRLQMFYLERARTSKTAARIFSKLDDLSVSIKPDTVDVPTLLRIDAVLAKYRALS
jgi:hypothetical protein